MTEIIAQLPETLIDKEGVVHILSIKQLANFIELCQAVNKSRKVEASKTTLPVHH
jgi:hypothetical protein